MMQISIVLERGACADRVDQELRQGGVRFERTRHQGGASTFKIPSRAKAHDLVLGASGLRHIGFDCAECGRTIRREEDGRSTYCGSMHRRCFGRHAKDCGACPANGGAPDA